MPILIFLGIVLLCSCWLYYLEIKDSSKNREEGVQHTEGKV